MKGVEPGSIEDMISSSGGPKTQATKADYVKFHDDKSTYTGVYAKYVTLKGACVQNTASEVFTVSMMFFSLLSRMQSSKAIR